MTHDEIIERLIDYLNQHRGGRRGYIREEPYKGDFFKLFKESHRKGYCDERADQPLTGDSVFKVLATRWLSDDETENETRVGLMRRVTSMWDEWRYAWDHYDA